MVAPSASLISSSARAKSSIRGGLLQRVAGYGVSRGATEGLLALRSILLAALLGPAAFGTWALLRIGMRYSALAGLGVFRGLEVELLQPGAERVTDRKDSPASSALGFVLLVSGIISAVALAAAVLQRDPRLKVLLGGFAAANLAESVFGYALVCTRVRTTLRRYAVLETSVAVLHVVWAVGLAHVWGLAGAFGGLAAANIIGILAAAGWVEFRPALVLEPLRRLLRVGLPVALTGCVAVLLLTADRWIIAIWGGPTMLGYYAFGASVITAAASLAVVIRTVVFRQVYGQASSDGAAAALRTHLELSLLPFARLLPPLLGVAGLAIAPLVASAMPGYTQAVAPARLFLLVGAAIGLVNLSAVGVIAAGCQRKLPVYAGIALVMTSMVSILALKARLGLEGVAGAALLGNVLYAASVLRLIVRETGASDANQFVLITLFPLVWCAGALVVVGHLLPGHDVTSTALAVGMYCLLLLPLVPGWRTEWCRVRGASHLAHHD
jgi:O-antigen/teichoic acid export membrane protein